MDVQKRYPVQYYCTHCAARGFIKKDGVGAKMTCPTCRFGTLKKMHWNGFRWS